MKCALGPWYLQQAGYPIQSTTSYQKAANAAIAAAGLAEIITSAAVEATTIQLRAVGW